MEERFVVAKEVGAIIVNSVTGGGLEFHNEHERVVARIPTGYARVIGSITDPLLEFEQGMLRREMFGILMLLLGSVIPEVQEI